MKHTPGPWVIEKPFKEPHIYIGGPKTELIACIKDHYENNMGNAHLIASAPDLYESLKQVLDSFSYWMNKYEGPSGVLTSEMFKMAQQAIAKAEGKE